MGKIRKDITGERYGMLVVIGLHETEKNNGRFWDCRCDCGNIKTIRRCNLTSGSSTSCGCRKNEIRRKELTTHGKTDTRLYVVWKGMKRRCFGKTHKNYEHYGGRGITVCDEWLGKNGFQNFYDWAMANGYDENAPVGKCTLDRINVNGNYEPSNCRWVEQSVQTRNKRNNHYITYNGQTKTITEWCKEYHICRKTISDYESKYGNEELALEYALKNRRYHRITYKGKTQTVSAWERELGFTHGFLSSRMREQNLTFEQAISYPLHFRRKEV